ncbi:MAG: hypothetical protein ACTHMY_19990 [Solirubrobacteraceae bacterium]
MRPKTVLTAVAFAALALTGCGAVRVQPTTPAGSSTLASRGQVDSPVKMKNHLTCLRDAHLPVQVVGPTRLQIGPAPAGPTIVFAATPGGAQNFQIIGSAQSAEVIGNALVYPNQGSDGEMATIGACLAQGVQG